MNYNSDHYYRIAYGITLLILIPFYIFIRDTVQEFYKSPSILLTALIIGMEFSYFFPRQAMKLYEEILFKSSIEKKNAIIQLLLFISFSGTEVYFFITGNIVLLFTLLIFYLLWYLLFQKQSIVVGDRNIIIGRKLIPHELVQSISINDKGILIEAMGQSFKIYNWVIGKEKNKLEFVVKQISEKIKD